MLKIYKLMFLFIVSATFYALSMDNSKLNTIEFSTLKTGLTYQIEAEIDEKQIGYIAFRKDDDRAHINIIMVCEAYRNKSVGLQLMQKGLAKITQLKCTTITLNAEPLDEATQLSKLVGFYQKFGFIAQSSVDSHTTSVFMQLKK